MPTSKYSSIAHRCQIQSQTLVIIGSLQASTNIVGNAVTATSSMQTPRLRSTQSQTHVLLLLEEESKGNQGLFTTSATLEVM